MLMTSLVFWMNWTAEETIPWFAASFLASSKYSCPSLANCSSPGRMGCSSSSLSGSFCAREDLREPKLDLIVMLL